MSVEMETVFRSRANSRSILLAAFASVLSGTRAFFRRRATNKALSRLTDHELNDIGLVRTEFGYRRLHHDRLGAQYWNR